MWDVHADGKHCQGYKKRGKRMNITDCIVIVVWLILAVGIPLIGISLEKKAFNNGFCPECGSRLEYFDTDSQGGRGYCCRKCNYHTWVSYDTVDKKYR